MNIQIVSGLLLFKSGALTLCVYISIGKNSVRREVDGQPQIPTLSTPAICQSKEVKHT